MPPSPSQQKQSSPSYDYNALVTSLHECRDKAYQEYSAIRAIKDEGRSTCNYVRGNDDDDGIKGSISVADEEIKHVTPEQKQQRLEIHQQDHLEYLQQALDIYQQLSTHCPMTPLLWMQYAHDTHHLMEEIALTTATTSNENSSTSSTKVSALADSMYDTALQILELGLAEFPGSAMLHLQYSDLTIRNMSRPSSSVVVNIESNHHVQKQRLAALEDTMQRIGQGSHRSDTKLLHRIHKWYLGSQLRGYYFPKDLSSPEEILLQKKQQLGLSLMVHHLQRNPIHHVDTTDTFIQDYHNLVAAMEDKAEWDESSVASNCQVTALEDARRYEAKYYSWMQRYEDTIQMALLQDGITMVVDWEEFCDDEQLNLDWDGLLQPRTGPSPPLTCWNGYGGMATAQAFIDYAQACSRHRIAFGNRNNNNDDEEESGDATETSRRQVVERDIHNLTLAIYERGVAECPTVETLWLSYLRQLQYLMTLQNNNKSKDDDGDDTDNNPISKYLPLAKSVMDRAVRNCPYSVALVQQRLKITMQHANAGFANVDPTEDLFQTTVLEQTLGMHFITQPQQIAEIFLTTTQVVRRRILFLLERLEPPPAAVTTAKNAKQKNKQQSPPPQLYDDTEPIGTPSTFSVLYEDTASELEDACTDLQEIYDDMDEYFKTKHAKDGKESRARLWHDRAITETHLLSPLLQCLAGHKNDDDHIAAQHSQECTRYKEMTKHFDKATNIFLPAHPTVFSDFIQALFAVFPASASPYHTLSKLRQVRFLYQKALKTIGKPKASEMSSSQQQQQQQQSQLLDYETALRCLCQDYLTFELHFGSDRSYQEASKNVQKKLTKAFSGQEMQPQSGDGFDTVASPDRKRKIDDDEVGYDQEKDVVMDGDSAVEPASKKQRTTEDLTVSSTNDKPTDLSVKKPTVHKVKVGNLEYPAHPFTIKVSFLSPQTQDMDLVDTFRDKCGAIVHARIMRDKHRDATHPNGKSKGWGVVQFEERDAVEKALQLNDVVGIDSKSVRIERSHLPAVSLVPPGQHRINPKGHGKSTKQNQRRKQEHTTLPEKDHEEGGNSESRQQPAPASVANAGADIKTKSPAGNTSAALLFRPRGIANKGGKPKAKIIIKKSDDE